MFKVCALVDFQVKMILDPDQPGEYLLARMNGHIGKGTGFVLLTGADGDKSVDSGKEFVLAHYEKIEQSHEQTATTMNATAVLNRYREDIYILDLRVQDPAEQIRKILSQGDAITNEGMLTSVKYLLNTPDIIASEGSPPELPIHTKMTILFRDGHSELADFLTTRFADRSDEEFEDPWF